MDRHPGIFSAAAAWIAGILLGTWCGGLAGWFGLGVMLTAVAWWRKRRAVWWLAAVVAVSAAWCVARGQFVSRDDVARYVGSASRLVRVTGVVQGPVVFSSPWLGAMGQFSYFREPNTLATLKVEQVMGHPASGLLLLRVREMDPQLKAGRRIKATGWLSPVRGPMNPGEMDYRKRLLHRGIVGQLSLAAAENSKDLGAVPLGWALPRWSKAAGDAAERTLNIGMEDDSVRLALLQTMLLGRWGRGLAGVDETFREVGLVHMLSISGAHLGILLGMVWLICRLLMIRPARAALMVLVVLGLFLLAVPPRVPIVRAGIMATILCGALWTGRRIDAKHSLALAALVVLIWRPNDLFSPGFQLSFLVVAALLWFTGPLLERLWPANEVTWGRPGLVSRVLRGLLGYVVASTVAFAVALPLVAYHFLLVSPLAIVLALAALPLLAAILAVGYAKIFLGLIVPSVSLILSGPLRWTSDVLLGLVNIVHDWPGATLWMRGEPSAAWCIGVSAVIWATLLGAFRGRRAAMIAAWCVAVGWTVWIQLPPLSRPPLVVDALAVGDGSCFLVRSEDRTLMFDCGSQNYMDVGLRSVNPALQALGVRRIDVMVISHSDMDHYCGMLDVAKRVAVGEVWLSPQLLSEAKKQPEGATAFLLAGLKSDGAKLHVVSRGEHMVLGETMQLDVLWPAADYQSQLQNDSSIVLSIRAADRRVLMTGDIQQDAIEHLLAAQTDLRADVCDLSHHGSMVDATGDFLSAVSPRIVLQSCGPQRRRDADWTKLLAGRHIERYVTDRDGMIELTLQNDGRIDVTTPCHPDVGIGE